MKGNTRQNQIELLRGTLDLLVLQTLSSGPLHGYGVGRRISSESGAVFSVDPGSLYPALHRLKRKRWIADKWKISENNQRVRVFRLTKQGRKQLVAQLSRWTRLSDAVRRILNPDPKDCGA